MPVKTSRSVSPAARAASIRARLLNRAKERGEDFNLLLTRYATERLLHRLSVSPARKQFLLKGALLFDLWFDVPHRPTRDADFLGFGPAEADALADTVRGLCGIEADDGMVYDAASVRVAEIREEANYGGLRVKLLGRLDTARITLQLDVGYGDAVIPEPTETDLPTILEDLPAARLLVYPRESVIAEKLEAIASLGMANSRMKDYFDLLALQREGRFDRNLLPQAIAATFQRRRTPIPDGLPLGLTSEFALDPLKQKQWRAFLSKNQLTAPPLEEAIVLLGGWLGKAMNEAKEIAPR